MFSIYGPDGRAFHDTLEALYRTRPKAQSHSEAEQQQSPQTPQPPQSINQNAVAAYRELIHAQPKDELHHLYEVMSRSFTNLPEEISAYSALLKIHESPFNELPVVNSQNCIIGMISYRSIFEQLRQESEELGLLKITAAKQYIANDVITAEPVTSIRRAAQVMHHYNLETLPVVDSYGATVGIITCKNIVSAVSNEPPLSIWS
ncbi:CBS domain-containing protein [uncultured Amphritea sp.]|uniref:CBS domain-containing protein n=1 Tax=uncultured Amphritea sp. TaxID=981605 RepID=UPI00262DA448|nr:CBS domain-containing protein [uncultured Amphritea sp.]